MAGIERNKIDSDNCLSSSSDEWFQFSERNIGTLAKLKDTYDEVFWLFIYRNFLKTRDLNDGNDGNSIINPLIGRWVSLSVYFLDIV